MNADRWPDDLRLSDIEPRFGASDAAGFRYPIVGTVGPFQLK
jgi:hypothetical protein